MKKYFVPPPPPNIQSCPSNLKVAPRSLRKQKSFNELWLGHTLLYREAFKEVQKLKVDELEKYK